METKDFRRNVYHTLNAKVAKEGMRVYLRKQKIANTAASILGTAVAVGKLEQDFRPYILGFQMADEMKKAGAVTLGEVLHHAVNVAKLLKVKVPPAQRKIKPKNTPTWLLTEIGNISSNLLRLYFDVYTPAKTEMVDKKKKDKAGKEVVVKTLKVTPKDFDVAGVSTQIAALLAAVYEFTWAVYHAPVANIFGAHIESLKPAYPAGFFDPPPKKPGPAKPVKAKKAAPAAQPQVAAKA